MNRKMQDLALAVRWGGLGASGLAGESVASKESLLSR